MKDTQADVLSERFGSDAANKMTVVQAADALGVSRQRVHQLIDSGVLAAEQVWVPKRMPFLVLDRIQVTELSKAKRPAGRPRKQ